MVNTKDVLKIASLSRLQISESDLAKFTHQMNNILDFIAKLNELDTAQVEPTSHAVTVSSPLREDEVRSCRVQDAVFEIAPDSESNLFRVPKVIV